MALSLSDNYMVEINHAYKQKATREQLNNTQLAFTMNSMLRMAEILPVSGLLQSVPKMVEEAEAGCNFCSSDDVDHYKDLRKYYIHVLKHLERLSSDNNIDSSEVLSK